LKKYFLLTFLPFLGIFFILSLYSDKRAFSVSGFEQNQSIAREEFYKKEIPKVYFRKIGYLYLTRIRFYLDKIDWKIASLPLFLLYLVILA
jgi:hypothetical protein